MEANNSLDRLAHIANMSRELHDIAVKEEKSPEVTERETMAMDGNEPVAVDNTAKIRRLACTECRQQKSRCDATEHYPNPCSRCQKKGIPCQLIPEFKRTQKRARIELIEKEFEKLKQSFMAPQAALDVQRVAPILSGRTLSSSPQPGITRYGSPADQLGTGIPVEILENSLDRFDGARRRTKTPERYSVGPNSESASVPVDLLACEEKSLDSVTLDPDSIAKLFSAYVAHYHPILPVVDIQRGPERIYRLCPALFWVIMFVALRRHSDTQLLLHLAPLIKNILAEITISPITRYNPTEEDEPIMNALSVFSVQAFILYTYWPPLTSSLSADSSWNTIGVALFQAIRIGLHSSGLLSDSDKEKSNQSMVQENMRTWIVCNIVAQNIATAFGFPAFVQFDSMRAISAEIPISTRNDMDIAHFEDQVAKTLTTSTSDNPMYSSERLALMKVLLRQLDELEVRLALDSDFDDGYRKFHALVARIHLLTHYFLDSAHIPPFDLTKGLVRLYNAAMSLITHAHMCQAKNEGFVRYMPAVHMLSLWQASCIIVKLANSPLKKVVDVELGKLTYLVAISLVAHASVLKHDIAYRASGIMRNMWQLFKTLDDKGDTGYEIGIRSRMAASVFFDCLSLLRDQVGMRKFHIRTDVRENSAEENAETNAVTSEDEEEPDEPTPKSESVKSTPGSSNSSKVRKKRSLSGLQDAESKARRIIRTIPLDPQPISAAKRSSIFKVVNTSTDTLPSVANDEEAKAWSPQDLLPKKQANEPPSSLTLAFAPTDDIFSEVDSLNVILDANSLWRDVDSLMNDFGFHKL